MKKNIIIFISGMLTMLVLVFGIGFIVNCFSNLPGLTYLSENEKETCITTSNLKVFQVIDHGAALAECGTFPNEILVLLLNDEGKEYYDNEIIKMPKGKCAKRIGTYQYPTTNGSYKTVPAVKIK